MDEKQRYGLWASEETMRIADENYRYDTFNRHAVGGDNQSTASSTV